MLKIFLFQIPAHFFSSSKNFLESGNFKDHYFPKIFFVQTYIAHCTISPPFSNFKSNLKREPDVEKYKFIHAREEK